MKRLGLVIKKELLSVKANLPFNLVTVLSPILFFLMFALMLAQDISLPVVVHPGPDQSELSEHIAGFSTPGGTPYFTTVVSPEPLERTGYANKIEVEEEPGLAGGIITGRIVQYFEDVNSNMTKNFRNRLTGAVSSYLGGYLGGGAISVEEITQYPRDIPWSVSFGASTLAMGILLAGLLFGSLSFTQEWEQEVHKFLTLSPVKPWWVLGGKMVAGVLKGLLATLLFLGVLGLLTRAIPARWGLLTGTIVLAYGCMVSLGMLVGILSRSTLVSFLVSLVGTLALWIAGGGFGSMAVFGQWMYRLSLLNPATHTLDLVRYVYFGGSARIHAGVTALIISNLVVTSLLYVAYSRKVAGEGAIR